MSMLLCSRLPCALYRISCQTAPSPLTPSPVGGYSNRGNALKRLFAYLAVVKPLVMRAVAKSDTLALSMELKGFGAQYVPQSPAYETWRVGLFHAPCDRAPVCLSAVEPSCRSLTSAKTGFVSLWIKLLREAAVFMDFVNNSL